MGLTPSPFTPAEPDWFAAGVPVSQYRFECTSAKDVAAAVDRAYGGNADLYGHVVDSGGRGRRWAGSGPPQRWVYVTWYSRRKARETVYRACVVACSSMNVFVARTGFKSRSEKVHVLGNTSVVTINTLPDIPKYQYASIGPSSMSSEHRTVYYSEWDPGWSVEFTTHTGWSVYGVQQLNTSGSAGTVDGIVGDMLCRVKDDDDLPQFWRNLEVLSSELAAESDYELAEKVWHGDEETLFRYLTDRRAIYHSSNKPAVEQMIKDGVRRRLDVVASAPRLG